MYGNKNTWQSNKNLCLLEATENFLEALSYVMRILSLKIEFEYFFEINLGFEPPKIS